MGAIKFLEEIHRIDLYQPLLDFEEELMELNNGGWQFSFGSEKDIVWMFKEILDSADFYNINTITDYGFYWCGMLTAEPFDELVPRKYFDEETLCNKIKEDFIEIEYKGGIYLHFKNNSKSPLYRFFYKYREDGYGENIPYSMNIMMNKLSEYIIEKMKKDYERYGIWEEVEFDCEDLEE